MKKNLVKLSVLNNLKETINIFGNIFLSTYFFDISDGNISLIFIFWIVYCTSNILYRLVICKLLDCHNVIRYYQVSIFLNFISVSILLFLGENIIHYILPFSLFYSLSISMYYATYENIVYDLNTNSSFKDYFVYNNIIYNILACLVPFFLGFLIDFSSYFLAFVLLFGITLFCFIYSSFLNNQLISCKPLKIKEYFRSIFNQKIYRKTILQNFFDGFNTGGPFSVLATLLIFSQFSSESIVGVLNSLGTVFALIASFLCIKFISKTNYTKTVLPLIILFVLIAIPISIYPKTILVILYILLYNIGVAITDIHGTTLTYELMNQFLPNNENNAYLWNIQFVFDIGRIFGYVLILIFYLFLPSYLYVLFILFSLGFLFRCFIINDLNKIKIS